MLFFVCCMCVVCCMLYVCLSGILYVFLYVACVLYVLQYVVCSSKFECELKSQTRFA